MQTVKIEYFGMSGQGKNLTEAKRDAGASIERALSGNYHPWAATAEGHTLIVYRDPWGWWYDLVEPNPESGYLRGVSGFASLDEAKQHGLSHLCQNIFAYNGVRATHLLDKNEAKEFGAWCDWQDAYKSASAHGADDEHARCEASRKVNNFCLCRLCMAEAKGEK